MRLLKPFIQIFIIASLLSSALIAYRASKKDYLHAESWLDNVYKGKDYINEFPTKKQRLVILSGSNSLFGFNGEIIDKNTKFRPINYATHAGIPLNYHIDRIMQHAKDGDIIFLPLEFEYYTYNVPKGDFWYINNMLYWGNGYDKYISVFDKISVYIKNSPPLSSINEFFKDFPKNFPKKDKEREVFSVDKMFHNTPFDFGYTSLSKYGDFCTQQGVSYERNDGYLNVDSKVSSFFISEYKRLESLAKKRNIKVFLTYPVTLENKEFSLKDSKTFEKIQNLKAQLAQRGIKIYGNFTDFHFERKYFFNTKYHLNDIGAILRTQNFVKLLESLQKAGEI